MNGDSCPPKDFGLHLPRTKVCRLSKGVSPLVHNEVGTPSCTGKGRTRSSRVTQSESGSVVLMVAMYLTQRNSADSLEFPEECLFSNPILTPASTLGKRTVRYRDLLCTSTGNALPSDRVFGFYLPFTGNERQTVSPQIEGLDDYRIGVHTQHN